MDDIIMIKDAFPKLLAKKIIEIHDMVNNKEKKIKPRINMTTKGPSRKKVIIPMSTINSEAIISQANMHIANINHLLKGAKSEISADFIHSDNKGVISDLNIIEKYVKGVDNIDSEDISSPCLFQLKSYLKILGIPYLLENLNFHITSDIIEETIKSSHFFNDVTLASCPQVIKASPKSDMVVIWVDI